MSLKFTGEFCVKTLKNDTKFEEESTCQFKTDMRSLTNFNALLENLKNLLFNGPKYIKFELIKYGEFYLMTLNIDATFEAN